MVTIYKRLLKYQESNARSNLENYLTEALCDYLNRLSPIRKKGFITKVIFQGCNESHIQTFLKRHNSDIETNIIDWKTQYSINISGTTKYPDLLCLINRKPAIIVEVKIGAGFTHRIHEDKSENTVITPQLKDYGSWLHSKNEHAVLVLLSHLTKPPDDFLKQSENYGVRQKNFINWQQIYNWLKTEAKDTDICLTNDLMNFLKECSMASESPNVTDLSVLEIFVAGTGEKINNMMKFTREELEKKFSPNMDWGKEKSSFVSDGLYTIDYKQKAVWSWVLLDSKEYSYLGWGICYPDEEDEWGWRYFFPDIPKKPFVFIGLFSEASTVKENYNKSLSYRPDNWLWNNNLDSDDTPDLIGIKIRDLNEFLSFDEDMTIGLFEFTNKGFEDIEKLVDKIVVK